MERFSVESCVRGYHVYKDIWIACVGEELPCQRENGNPTDPFAVAVVKSVLTVGHIPRKISSVCSLFLRRNGVMTVCTTERRRFSADLPQGGLEIPCLITFEGAGKDIQKVRKLVTAAMLPTDDIQQTKKRKISVGGSEDTREWVQCGGIILTNQDKQILFAGQKLTDQHINYAQSLLRLQFPKLNGLQSTLYQSRSEGFKTTTDSLQINPFSWRPLDCCNNYTL